MSAPVFRFGARAIPFRPGESVASALDAAGIALFGHDALGQENRYFCGIGACQNCLALIDGVARETCLTQARTGMSVAPMGTSHGN